MKPVRSRWTALPLAAALAVPVLAAVPAAASTSPSSEYLGYLSTGPSGSRYVVRDAAGAGVFTSPAGAIDGSVGHATDAGPTIAYVTETDSTSSYVDRLHVVQPGGSDTVVYTAAAGTDITEPALSPSGSDVLFAVDDDSTSAIVDVALPSLAVRTIRRSTSTLYFGPSFSPDGGYLSWAQQTNAGSDLVVTRFATGAASVLSHTDATGNDVFGDTAWSPDGSRLAAVRGTIPAGSNTPIGSLEVVDLRTGEHKVVLAGAYASGVETHYLQPAWAADGSGLYTSKVTVISSSSTKGELVRYDLGSGATDTVATETYNGSPSTAGPAISDTVAPAPVTAPTATVSGTVAHVTFTPPSDTDTADIVITRTEGSPADTATATIEVGRTRGTSFDVPLPNPATTYGISLFARDWSGNLSPAAGVTVTSAATSTVAISPPPSRVTYRTPVRFTGTLRSSAPVAGAKVLLYARRAMTTTPVAVASATTAADGSYSLAYTPAWTAEYTVRFAGSPAAYPAVSAKRVVTVVPVVSLALSTSRTYLGRTVTVSGGVAPSHAGQLVSLQRYVGGSWRTIASTRLSSASAYRFALRPTTRGTWTLRMVKTADRDHATAYSPMRTLTVG